MCRRRCASLLDDRIVDWTKGGFCVGERTMQWKIDAASVPAMADSVKDDVRRTEVDAEKMFEKDLTWRT